MPVLCGLLLLLSLLQSIHGAPLIFTANSPALSIRSTAFSHVVVFGDSLSDKGNGAWTISNHTWPADPHYFGHRFSNGPVYAENIASHLKAFITSYAVGGATTNNSLVAGFTGPGSTIPSPSILDQIHLYAKHRKEPPPPRTLYIVYGGANDAFFGLPSIKAEDSVESLLGAVKALRKLGAKHFLLPTLPPLGAPYPFSTLVPSYSAPLATFSSSFRSSLFSRTHSDPSIFVADFYSLFESILKDPKKYGFDSALVSESCLRGVYMEVEGGVTVCRNPEEYIWWDEYHPTERVHALMAHSALKILNGHN